MENSEQQNPHYPFVLPPLPYAYTAIEPYIDTLTMQIHHNKHMGTYVNNLNAALEGYPPLQDMPLEELIPLAASKAGAKLPHALRTAILHNGGGVYNHTFFFKGLRSSTGQITVGQSARLISALTRDFGGVENFKTQFSAAANNVFGSGYAWLVVRPENSSRAANHKLSIIQTKNQETPLPEDCTPLLCLDVWEHAYYLKYQNMRNNYISAFWNIVDWTRLSSLLETFCARNDCIG